MVQRTITVVGMFTEEMGNEVKNAVTRTLRTAVDQVEVNPVEQTLTVTYDEQKIALDDVKDAIIVNGYMPEP